MRGPTWWRRADEIGAATTAVIADRLERACAKAIAVDDPTYRTIKGILAVRREADPPPPSTGDGGAAAFLHGPSRLFGNVVALPNPDGTATASTDTDTAPAGGDRDGSGHDQPGRGVSA